MADPIGEKIVITVLSSDRPGIVAGVTKVLAELNVNILELSQTVLDGVFSMIAIADISTSGYEFKKIRKDLETESENLKVNLLVQRKEIFDKMHRI